MRTGPLTSLKVIELCNVVAGPFAGSLLADWGADVIKIEMPGKGDPFRAFLPYDDANHEVSLRWITMGRNKRCVTLDLHGEKATRSCWTSSKMPISLSRTSAPARWKSGASATTR